MAILDPVSIPTKGTALLIGTTLIGGASGISGFGSGAANKINITALNSDREITRKGLISEGSVSIDGIFAPQSAAAQELEAALQSDTGYNFTIRVGGNIGADGLATGHGRIQRAGLAFSTIAGTSGDYDITLGSAKQLPAIVDGDSVRIGATLYEVVAVSIDSTGNGVLNVATATDITDPDGGTVDLIRPAITYAFTGTVDGFMREMATNEVMRYNLTIGSIAGIEASIVATLSA